MHITSKQAAFLNDLLQHLENEVYSFNAAERGYIVTDREWLHKNINDLIEIRKASEYWATTNNK
jgi:hypothetical protein